MGRMTPPPPINPLQCGGSSIVICIVVGVLGYCLGAAHPLMWIDPARRPTTWCVAVGWARAWPPWIVPCSWGVLSVPIINVIVVIGYGLGASHPQVLVGRSFAEDMITPANQSPGGSNYSRINLRGGKCCDISWLYGNCAQRWQTLALDWGRVPRRTGLRQLKDLMLSWRPKADGMRTQFQ